MARIEMWTRRTELLLANPLMIGTRMTFGALKVLEAPIRWLPTIS
ncbi:MAG: hypothetical protein WDN06_07945 [Asticcacaulis sp.]